MNFGGDRTPYATTLVAGRGIFSFMYFRAFFDKHSFTPVPFLFACLFVCFFLVILHFLVF